jgi:hypothetical protein
VWANVTPLGPAKAKNAHWYAPKPLHNGIFGPAGDRVDLYHVDAGVNRAA